MTDPIATQPLDAPTLDLPGPPGPLPAAPPGYEILEEVGHGGMGTVYRARDLSLEREVALKYMHPRLAEDPWMVERFLHEARVTARLQHPGIPPVHQVGRLADGRPYLAMKLIRGQTLDRLLRERGAGAARWLGVFEAICQAVGYAHAQGVIHRDLKPANVMVGAFGEVQVMDWGLAKVLAGPSVGGEERAARGEASGECDTDVHHTEAGNAIGTLAFIPPEQAKGAVEELDRRSDVFGLGAVLCTLLTGQPPYVAPVSEVVRQLAVRGQLQDAFARLESSEAEPELIALAKRCLAVDRKDRPADAGDLAAAVGGLRHAAEERARQAELEQAQAEVREAEQRKRRRLLLAAVSGVLVVLVAGVIGTSLGYVRAERARQEEQRQRTDAEEARDQAKGRYLLALETFHQMVFGIQNRLERHPGTQQLRKEMLESARAGLRKLVAEAERQGNPTSTLVWAYFRMGDVELTQGNVQAARQEYQAGHDLAARLSEDDPNDFLAQRDLAESCDRLGDVARKQGETKEALKLYQRALELRRRRFEAEPGDPLWQSGMAASYGHLGDMALHLGRTKEALEHYEKANALYAGLVCTAPKDRQHQRRLSIIFNRLGDTVLVQGHLPKALDYYHRSLQIRQGLLDADPENAQAQRDLAVCYDNLGDVSRQLDQTKEALGYYQKSMNLSRHLAEEDSRNAQAQMDLFIACYKVGMAALEGHEFAVAQEWLSKARGMLLEFERRGWITGKRQMVGTWDVLQWEDDLRRRLWTAKKAESAVKDLGYALAQPAAEVGDLLDFRLRVLVKRQRIGEAIKTVECWRDWAERQEQQVRDRDRYNAACGFAVCAVVAKGGQREALTRQCLALLRKLRDAGYFRDERHLAHLGLDRDLAPLRDDPGFVEFEKSLRK